MVDWAKLAAEMSGEGAPVSEDGNVAPEGDAAAAPAAAAEDPAQAAQTQTSPAPRVDPRTLDDSGAVPASALRSTDPMGTPTASFAAQLNKQTLSFESAPAANVADTPLGPTDPDRPSAAPAASPEAVASVPLEVSKPGSAEPGHAAKAQGDQAPAAQKPADWDLSGPVQMTMPSPSVPAPAPVGPMEFKVPPLGASTGKPAKKNLEGFGGAGVDDPTKTSPFPGESAGPWEVPQTPPPEDAPDQSIISEITDPRKKLARDAPGAPIASNPDGAPAGAPVTSPAGPQTKPERPQPSQPSPMPITGITPTPTGGPPSIDDDDDDEPSKTQHLPEGEMLRRLDGAFDEDASRPKHNLGGLVDAPSREDATDRDLPSIAASDDATSETEVARPLPSLLAPGALADQAQAGVGPFAPPSVAALGGGTGTLPGGTLSEGPSLEESLTRSLAEEEARTASIVADDDDDEAASTLIDHKMPPGAALDGFGGNSDEQPPVSAPPTPAADVPVEATEKVTRVREKQAADAFFEDGLKDGFRDGFNEGDDDETKKVDIVASGEDEADVTLKMPAAEGPASTNAQHDDSEELFGGTAPPHEATEKMPRAKARDADKHADAFFKDGFNEGDDELSKSLPEPEERSHYAPQSDVSPWSEDDEDPSLVLARAQKRTRLLTAAGLLLALIAGAIALVVITPEPGSSDDAPGETQAGDVPAKHAGAEGDAPDDQGPPAGDDKPTGEDKDPKRAGGSKAEPGGNADEARDKKADEERAARLAKRDDDQRKADARRRERSRAAEEQDEAERRDAQERTKRIERSGRSRQRDADAAKDDDDEAKRDNGRSRRRDRGTRVAGATERELAVTAPKRVIWRTPSGKRLGKGSGFLKLAPGVSTVVAHDPFANVKTFIKVTGAQISYAQLPKGKLDIRAFPYAAVYAGKKKLGDAPFPPLEVVEGQYRLRFVYEGKVQKRLVKVKAGKTERVKVNFMQ